MFYPISFREGQIEKAHMTFCIGVISMSVTKFRNLRMVERRCIDKVVQ